LPREGRNQRDTAAEFSESGERFHSVSLAVLPESGRERGRRWWGNKGASERRPFGLRIERAGEIVGRGVAGETVRG
jgi:hypothetical protein